ncbi:MAG: 50S ribosomal protein L15 [Phycisphaerales bacterium]|jgi:large subunit ribosomal protein L15
MMIHDITAKVGPHKKIKRLGRGEGSGRGGTSGRGHKGAKSRAGWNSRPGYQGGATPFMRRFPKRGFSNAGFRTEYYVINVRELEKNFEAGATVDIDTLVKLGLIPNAKLPLKVLGTGDLKKKLAVVAAAFSASARSKIEAAGGSCSEPTK